MLEVFGLRMTLALRSFSLESEKLEAMAAHNVLKTLYPDSSNFVLQVKYLQCCMTSSSCGHR